METLNKPGIFTPPDGLSLKEQARWFLKEPEMFMLALIQQTISEELMKEIELCEKEFEIAMKFEDRKNVDGLTNEERQTIFASLTGGAELSVPRKGRSPKAMADLRLAYGIRDVDDMQERSKLLHDAISREAGGYAENDTIYRRIKRVEKLWVLVKDFDSGGIERVLDDTDLDSMTADDIVNLLTILRDFEEQFRQEMELDRPPLCFRGPS